VTVSRPQLHHLALTVSDLDASAEWYSRVFDVRPQMDVPHPGGVGRVLADDAWSLMIALHRHDGNGGERFAETRTGLDHAGFVVPTRADLEQWQEHLERNGVRRSPRADQPLTQSPVVDEPYGAVLTFRDPDNLALELFAPPPEG
jgi:glyoxylase I family protein